MRLSIFFLIAVAMVVSAAHGEGFYIEFEFPAESRLQGEHSLPDGYDLDGDGIEELVIRETSGWPDSGTIVVYSNNYEELWSYTKSGLSGDLIFRGFADMNEDGSREMLVSYWDQNVSMYSIDVVDYPNATILASFQYGSGSYATVADLDNDEQTEIILKVDGGTTQIWAMNPLSATEHNFPSRDSLGQNYPNPFNPQTKITFRIAQREAVTLQVFDTAGRLVRVLIDGEVYEQGSHETIWTGVDDMGRQLASGTYFYQLEAGSLHESQKMVLLK